MTRRPVSMMFLVGLAALVLNLGLLGMGSAALAAEHAGRGDILAVDLSAFEGHWQRIEENETDQERLSAIERAIGGLSWIVRKMASGVLRSTTTPPPELQFAWDGRMLYQGVEGEDGGYPRPVELDGVSRTFKDPRGVDFSSSWAWTDDGLRVKWEQRQAVGSNVYQIDQQNQTLVVRHTIVVTAMSNIDPIVFLSRFSRTDRPARAATGLEEIESAADY